jgi:hypothetical protein
VRVAASAVAVFVAACAPGALAQSQASAPAGRAIWVRTGAAGSGSARDPRAAAPDPSGQPMPTGNLPGWRQVFSDDFRTDVPLGGFSGCTSGSSIMTSTCTGLPAAVAAKWWAYPDGWTDSAGDGSYEPSQTVSISGGLMNVHLHTADGIHMVAALVPKIPGGVNGNGLMYGRYSVRFRADEIAGYKTAWLLWPDSNVFPQDGEIDFPEADLDTDIWGYVHYQGGTAVNDQAWFETEDSYGSWHTATTIWTPTAVTFMLDGTTIGTVTQRIPDTPMHWVLQCETSTYGITPADSTSGNIQIAWAVAYRRD